MTHADDERAPGAGIAVTERPLRILVVEDDPVTREQFEVVLKAQDYAVVSASNAEDALQQMQAVTVSAILLDLHLPDVGGLELLQRIRATPGRERVPVVVITGDYFLDDAVSKQVSALGARIYFKPVWADELAQLARELVGPA